MRQIGNQTATEITMIKVVGLWWTANDLFQQCRNCLRLDRANIPQIQLDRKLYMLVAPSITMDSVNDISLRRRFH